MDRGSKVVSDYELLPFFPRHRGIASNAYWKSVIVAESIRDNGASEEVAGLIITPKSIERRWDFGASDVLRNSFHTTNIKPPQHAVSKPHSLLSPYSFRLHLVVSEAHLGPS